MYLIILIVLLAGFLLWNFKGSIRRQLKGYSTILETAIAAAIYYFDIAVEGIKEAEVAGYVPDGLAAYLPAVLFGWIIFKRFQTTSPVGKEF